MSNSKSFLNNLLGKASNVQNFVENILRDPPRSPSQRAGAPSSSSSSHGRSHSTPASNTSSKLCSGCSYGSHDSTCLYCGDFYCKTCLIQKVHFSAGRSQWLCKRCVVFTAEELNWDILISMSVKDLRWFLSRNKISDEHVKEKEQLVELIINHCGREGRSCVTEEDRHRSTESRRSMESKDLSKEQPQSSSMKDKENTNDATSAPGSPNYCMKRPPPSYETLYPRGSSSSATNLADNQTTSPAENSVNAEHAVKKVKTHIITNKDQRIHLDDIENEETLNQLSVKQLKDLLTCNFVNFKGCVERSELMSRAVRLWISHQENKQIAEEQNQRLYNDSQPSEVVSGKCPDEESRNTNIAQEEDKCCRICMENIIDCVFLDCGHMLTCVKCGKLLAECPICRQNIVRVVRVFHS